MATKTHARVLIIGGSVAGLTLANAFEQTGIDYLLLEQWHEIAPDVGASIAIFPNGARILDQLGCYDQSIRLLDGADAFDLIQTKEEDGGVISFVPNGYTPFFTDRQMVIRTLYDNLKDKTRILMSQKVVRVEQTADTVKVSTKVGETYSAEVLVGADGIHSKVRREMWRLAANKLPGYFQSGEGESVRTQYCCIFGISKPIDKFPKQCSYYVRGNGHSYLCSIGPGNRIYWFLFKKLKKPVYGLYEKIPRYDEAELEALVSEHVNDPIGEGMCFGDLYRMRKVATLQALPEFNLIGGQGGNSAIEDAAVLTNELLKLLESESSETSHLTTSSLENAFQRM
ncbi:hypothetical protein COCMIDRAFT_8624 [Bipolaris oryzae ATCC 44560]|uniref:FAD-binding domain-containing protein n=1 Tax=Bipolaris oryzae ATCC 44560 TaxID=930090 RepID=W6YQK2_COCMI|nr:uncharacterized protein COCMIDRAFT_8624 [Bipolaris oryzae ATCC 44560]EUC41697.1 hypothetical protein COCMIDRAFT_8624 [Bipolaris oryzae ATCC 44560]